MGSESWKKKQKGIVSEVEHASHIEKIGVRDRRQILTGVLRYKVKEKRYPMREIALQKIAIWKENTDGMVGLCGFCSRI